MFAEALGIGERKVDTANLHFSHDSEMKVKSPATHILYSSFSSNIEFP
jgi:hypothetical protein